MGFVTVTALVDTTLLLFFLTIAISAPLLDSQTILPAHLFPTPLKDLKHWYIQTFRDYLVRDKPTFFVALVWVELLLQWPLSLLCIYGILRNKRWLSTTCLIYGVSTFTSMGRTIAAPLLDAQIILPSHLFPTLLKDLKHWYIETFGDYLVREKPSFFVGLVWVELVLQWPLAVLCIFGILRKKRWLSTTCLMYGVSTFTSMVAILAELTGSEQASENLLKMYMPFLGAAILSILRGLTRSGKATTAGGKHAVSRKKRA